MVGTPRQDRPDAGDEGNASVERPQESRAGTRDAPEPKGFAGTSLALKDRRIEVLVTRGPDGKEHVLLQDLSHGPGIGWYVQKTIRLDREQVDALLRELCCARRHGATPCPERSADGSAPRILQLEPYLRR
jgi:hypothetical protein